MVEKLGEIFSEYGYPVRIINDRGLDITSLKFEKFFDDKAVSHN